MKSELGEEDRGRSAETPLAIPPRGWWDIVLRVRREAVNDDLQIIAAGIAFYFFLAVFPLLAATISIYGLFVTPAGAEEQIAELFEFLPRTSQEAFGEIAQTVAAKSNSSLGLGVFFSVVLSLWSANKGTKALVRGLNLAYGARERRKYFKQTLLSLAITSGAFVGGLFLLVLVAGVPAAANFYQLPQVFHHLISLGRWPLITLIIILSVAVLYRWAPNRPNARWVWITPGSLVATILWLIGSAAFSYYVDRFDSMGKTYGSFAAVISLMLWFLLTAFVILLGAEVNSECEQQTEADTSVPPEKEEEAAKEA